MKNTTTTIFIVLIFSLNSIAQIIKSDKGIYLDQNNIPYTGIYNEYYENGEIRVEINLKNGVQDGLTNIYFENGIKNEHD